MQLSSKLKDCASSLEQLPLLVVFDRDGTLVPISNRPEDARISAPVNELLSTLALMPGVTVGILSARGLGTLINEFKDESIILAGNYGLEIRFPHAPDYVHPAADALCPLIAQAKLELMRSLGPETRIIIDDHRLSLCLHWHLTPVELRGQVHNEIGRIKLLFPQLRVRTLPTSYEVFPLLEFDKSLALERIELTVNNQGLAYERLYAGDSESDEVGFGWVNARGGISIRVGGTTKSAAGIQVESPAELIRLIEELICLRKTWHDLQSRMA